jgi:hypothetical protein
MMLRYQPRSSYFVRAGMGDDQTDWYNAADYFRQARQKLNTLEDGMRADSGFAQQYGADIVKLENQYQSLLQQFLVGYRAVFGTVPSGVSGLGWGPVVIGITAAVVVAGITALIYELNKYLNILQTRAATAGTQAQAQTQALSSLITAAQQATAAGDSTTANALYAQAAQVAQAAGLTAAPASTDFFSQYGGTLLIGALMLGYAWIVSK